MTKSKFYKRGKLILRRRQDGGETFYTPLTINDAEVIRALEQKCLDGHAPTKVLSDLVKRAFHDGLRL